MNVTDFIRKWYRAALAARSASQQHFSDLCDVLGHERPPQDGPDGERVAERKGVAVVDYVPFRFFRRGSNVFLEIQKIGVDPVVRPGGTWAGDWFFNTDETDAQGAYRKMLEHSVIAAFGYGHEATKHQMDLPAQGERVFAYVNGVGIIAVGRTTKDESHHDECVFGVENGDEFHRDVEWIAVASPSDAVTAAQSSQWGYNLPVRCTIGRFSDGRVARLIADELHRRASTTGSDA